MKTTSDHAQEILDRSASPAVSLRDLIEALEREGVTATGTTDSVLRDLHARPDLFRVLEPHVGPWRVRRVVHSRATVWTPDTWILGLRPHDRPSSPIRARLAETLRSLGRRVDQGSATATARWALLMVRESTTF